MIYTLGVKHVYDRQMELHPNLEKGIGGSVWQTKEDADRHKRFCNKIAVNNWDVYGVEADWDKDTKVPETLSRQKYRSLNRTARLVKL